MPESPMVGARVPQEWQQQIQFYCRSSWAEGSLMVREVIAQYLGRTDPAAVLGAFAAALYLGVSFTNFPEGDCN